MLITLRLSREGDIIYAGSIHTEDESKSEKIIEEIRESLAQIQEKYHTEVKQDRTIW